MRPHRPQRPYLTPAAKAAEVADAGRNVFARAQPEEVEVLRVDFLESGDVFPARQTMPWRRLDAPWTGPELTGFTLRETRMIGAKVAHLHGADGVPQFVVQMSNTLDDATAQGTAESMLVMLNMARREESK